VLPAYAQTELETQQKANEKLLQLAKNARTPAHDYVIGRGDLVAVEVFDVPELSRDLRVSQTGTIGLPLLPVRLYVAGLTEIQVQQKVAEVLAANGLVANPQVTVFVKEKRSKPIAVVGAVGRPGVYQADHAVTLIEILAESGGIATDAGDTVIVTRGGVVDGNAANPSEPPEIGPEQAVPLGDPAPSSEKTTASQMESQGPAQPVRAEAPIAQNESGDKRNDAAVPPPITNPEPPVNTITVNLAEILERGDTTNNIPMQAGDVVTVPHAGIVYALGAVQRPGGFVANNDRAQLSTLKLLALAGGTTRIAKKNGAVIIRKDAEGHQQAIPVDLGKIVRRESEDVRLLPSDILYVPDNHVRAGLLRFGEIALAIGTSLAIYRIGSY